MINVAFIPVRGGSKSIPLKNIKIINGQPLIYWTAKAASECRYIDKVYIATDSDVIKQTVEELGIAKVEVIGRSAKTATDTASTESAMLEFAMNYRFDNIVLVQATSPLLSGADLDGGFQLFMQNDTDSVLSVVPQKRFNWNIDDNGYAAPINYDYLHRPRRQEFDGYYTENGAFYITRRELLLETGNRMSGKIRAYPMSENTFLEIDEPSDFEIIESIMKERDRVRPDGAKIRLFLTDSDGCLTDGGMYYDENGDCLKKFNAKDGMGISILRKSGIVTGIVTGEDTNIVRKRAEKLKMSEVHVGVKDKLRCVQQICSRLGIRLEETAYVGDDINDIDVLKHVGYPFSVPNAEPEVLACARYISRRNGGQGAVRDIAEMVMKINNDEEIQ